MKKILTIALALFLSTLVMAQEENDAPNMWLGGQLTFGSFSNADFTLGPSWGMMLGERFGIGAGANLSFGNNMFATGISPYARYYIPIVPGQFAFYGDAYLGIGGGDTSTDIDNVGEYFYFSIGARAGLQYWFTPRWSLAASTGLLDFTQNDGDSSFGAGVNFNNVNFSLFWHF